MITKFDSLVAEVRAVSPTAAAYLREHGIRDAGWLTEVFVWGETPAGHQYWSDIADAITHGWPE